MPRPSDYKTPQSIILTGFNSNVSKEIPTDIWPLGSVSPTIEFAGTPGSVSLVSDDANDIAAGSGAEVVRLLGITDTFDEFTEELAMDGLNPVVSVRSDYLHVQDMEVIESGALQGNAGQISATLDGGVVNGIAPEASQSQSAALIIPASIELGTVAHLMRFSAMITKDKSVGAFRLRIYDPDTDTIRTGAQFPVAGDGGEYDFEFNVPERCAAGSRLVVQCEVNTDETIAGAGLQFAWF